MKIFIAAICLLIAGSLSAQEEFIGNWEGPMTTMQGSEIIFVLKVKKDKNNPITFYCPSMGIKDIIIDNAKLKPDTVFFNIPKMNSRFAGNLINDSTIVGSIYQSIFENKITLHKKEKVREVFRPQEPIPPFSYNVQEVKFKNKEAGITLGGTLTLPEKSFNAPCVILISGSGQQNRDEEIMGHKPFLLLADYFTSRGIAVFRFDDRGIGESGGDPTNSTSRDFAGDVSAAIKFLRNNKGIKSNGIGLVGHSEGGIIAGMVAAQDTGLAFVIALAGPSIPGDIILQEQTRLILRKEGVAENAIEKTLKATIKIHKLIKKQDNDKVLVEKIKKEYKKLLKKLSEEDQKKLGLSENTLNLSVQQIANPWFKFFIKYNPADDYSKITCPFLAINGSEDIQVPAEINMNGYKTIFAKSAKTDYELKTFPGLNHLFQKCLTCDIMEYGLLEETFNKEVMEYLSNWILKH